MHVRLEHSVLGGMRAFRIEKNEIAAGRSSVNTDGSFASRAGIYWERAEYSMIPMTEMQ